MEVLFLQPARQRGLLASCVVLLAFTGCASYQPMPLEQVRFMERAQTQERGGREKEKAMVITPLGQMSRWGKELGGSTASTVITFASTAEEWPVGQAKTITRRHA